MGQLSFDDDEVVATRIAMTRNIMEKWQMELVELRRQVHNSGEADKNCDSAKIIPKEREIEKSGRSRCYVGLQQVGLLLYVQWL